jgi:hypothetical protein
MAVEALKSTSITNLDASPVVPNTAGEGAGAPQLVQSEYVTVSALASATSTYRMIRVATTVKLKELILESEAMGAGAINISVYYSDSTTDGTAVANQGVIVPTTGNQFFASDINLASAQNNVQVMNESGNNGLANRNLPFWQALGLTADPGGFFDIVAVVHTTDITTGAAKLGLRLTYTA